MHDDPMTPSRYDDPENIRRNLIHIAELSSQMETLMNEIDRDFDAFDWDTDVNNAIILDCFRIAFLIDSVIQADPSYRQTFIDQLKPVSDILDEFYTNPIEPDEDLFWTFAVRIVPEIMRICDSLIPDLR